MIRMTRAKSLFLQGGRQGVKNGLSLLVLMVPISFLVAILDWAGGMRIFSQAISPAFNLFGLPGSAALAFVSGALLNCYSAIAIMIALPLSPREITILSLMVLFSHNLPIELSVQKKTGSSILLMLFYRLGAGVLAGVALNLLMPGHVPSMLEPSQARQAVAMVPFSAMLITWTQGSLTLIIKIMLIIMGLMILNQFLKESGVMPYLMELLSPLLKVVGLTKETAYLFIVANTLGLAYGSGVMLGEKQEGRIADKSIRELNVFIATCHSLLEDTLLFVAIGASLFWVTLPRLIVAGCAVWVYRWVKGEGKNTSTPTSRPM
jgi:spore maturation protein SpmB